MAHVASLAASELVGTLLDGRYQLQAIRHAGAGAVVFDATARGGAAVTVKVRCCESTSATTQFFADVAAAQDLAHRNIAAVVAAGCTADDLGYVVLDDVAGLSLAQLRTVEPRQSLRRSVALIDQLLVGLGHAHQLGVIHGGLTSHRVRIRGAVVVVADFPAMRVEDHPAVDARTDPRAVEYLAPERVTGAPASVASDLYAVGALWYELLTGRTPFAAAVPHDVLAGTLRGTVRAPSQRGASSARADALVLRLLARRPEQRFASALEVRAALRALPADTVEVDQAS